MRYALASGECTVELGSAREGEPVDATTDPLDYSPEALLRRVAAENATLRELLTADPRSLLRLHAGPLREARRGVPGVGSLGRDDDRRPRVRPPGRAVLRLAGRPKRAISDRQVGEAQRAATGWQRDAHSATKITPSAWSGDGSMPTSASTSYVCSPSRGAGREIAQRLFSKAYGAPG